MKARDQSAAERLAELEAQNRRLQRLVRVMTEDTERDGVLVELVQRDGALTLVVCAPHRDEMALSKLLFKLLMGEEPIVARPGDVSASAGIPRWP